jgi:homoserine O-acetyltransferase
LKRDPLPVRRWENEGGALNPDVQASIDAGLFSENERLMVGIDPSIAEIGDLQTSGGKLISNVRIAYQTFGEYTGDNAILICHALTGTSNVIGWWDRLVGPGLAIDTDRYSIIGNNLLGGCQGSTGPTTASDFPIITVEDQVAAQAALLKALDIDSLHAVVGCSTGGFHALHWAVSHPVPISKVIVSASGARQNARQLALNEAARQAIMRDPKWLGGDYSHHDPPAQGLAVARMIGHIAYLSGDALELKFGRNLQNDEINFSLKPQFAVESYLNYQGDKFVGRFDANSFLVLTRAANFFDLKSLKGADSEFLFIAYTSDTLFPPSMSEELVDMANQQGLKSELEVVNLPYGHDAFLLDDKEQGAAIERFL